MMNDVDMIMEIVREAEVKHACSIVESYECSSAMDLYSAYVLCRLFENQVNQTTEDKPMKLFRWILGNQSNWLHQFSFSVSEMYFFNREKLDRHVKYLSNVYPEMPHVAIQDMHEMTHGSTHITLANTQYYFSRFFDFEPDVCEIRRKMPFGVGLLFSATFDYDLAMIKRYPNWQEDYIINLYWVSDIARDEALKILGSMGWYRI